MRDLRGRNQKLEFVRVGALKYTKPALTYGQQAD